MRGKNLYFQPASVSRRDALRGLGSVALGLGIGGFEWRGAIAFQAEARIPSNRAQATLEPHRFTIGSFDVVAVPDGTVTFPNVIFPLPPAQLLFVDAPEEERAAALREAGFPDWVDAPESAAVTLPVLPLVVDTGRTVVLFDTGYGVASPVPTGGRLLESLRAAGIDPADIDVVVLSHLHPDHILGAVDRAGKPTFVNARYVTGKGEYAFWSDTERVAATFPDPATRAGVLGPIEAVLPAIETRLTLVDDVAEEEIVPGIRAVAAPGHTPGHMAVTIASGGSQVLATFDTFVHPLHLSHPDWNFVGDTDPAQTEKTRRVILERAEAEGMPIIGYHLPYPGLGRAVREGNAWQWHPGS